MDWEATNDNVWEETKAMIKKVNARMKLLRNTHKMIHLWVVFCRSVVEQSCVVWHSFLTKENRDDLERTQKTFFKKFIKRKICWLWKCPNHSELKNTQIQKAISLWRYTPRKWSSIKWIQEDVKKKYNVKFANTNRLKNSKTFVKS